MFKYQLLLLTLLPFTSACTDFESWLDSYKEKSRGFYLINVFDSVISIPNVFHVTSFSEDNIYLSGLGSNLENLGMINYTVSDENKELAFPLEKERIGSCYGLDIKIGSLSNSEVMMIVADSKHVLLVSSKMAYLPQLLFMPMEEKARAAEEEHRCQLLYGAY